MWTMAAGLGVFAAFWLILGVVMATHPTSERDVEAGVTCLISGGLVPAAVATLLFVLGFARRRRAARLTNVAWLAGREPGLDPATVAGRLGLEPRQTEALLKDSWTAGILEAAPIAAAPMAVAPTIAAPISAPTPAPLPARHPHRTSPAKRPSDRAPAGRTLIGTVLNRTYRIVGHVGDGAMGTVYAAEHARVGRRVAVKTLHRDARLSDDAIRRFEREATTAGSLGHPNIVAVHDFDVTPEGVHYLVMDLLDGESLEQRLAQRGTLSWPEARRIVEAIGSALVAAHRVGILHRDIKPANILLARGPDGSERAVLVDFGLARPLDPALGSHITQAGAAIGTPAYMSPEQARGLALDARSDVYGLGAVLYEMVVGTPPFIDQTAAEVYARLLTEPAPMPERLPTDCPPDLLGVLRGALAREPERRFAGIGILLHALGSLDEHPVASHLSVVRA